jgi:phage gp36-like protein
MAYVTNTDIEIWMGTATVIELTDDAGTGNIDAAKVTEARLGAEAEADSYLATRYAVPVDVSGEPGAASVLRQFVLDLAAYRLHGRRPPVPEDVARRRSEAAVWLAQVVAGQVHLPAALAVRQNAALGIIGEAAGPKRTMTRESLENI